MVKENKIYMCVYIYGISGEKLCFYLNISNINNL